MSEPHAVDLHTHTVLSDGVLEPRELVRAARRAGVTVLAVTDHDTTEAIPDARDEASALGVRLVPGMEVSAHLESGDPAPASATRGVHVLAYFPAESLPRVVEWQAARRRARWERLERMLELLAGLGAPVARERFEPLRADARRTPGRLHVARELVAAGHVAHVQDAFQRYLGAGCPAYVSDAGPDVAAACALVHELRGLAVVAHPGVDGLDGALEALREAGVDGVEAYHAAHAPDVARRYHERARALGMLVTGGSDYHGELASPGGGEAGRMSPGASPPQGPDPGGDPARPRRQASPGNVPLPLEEWQRFDAALRDAAARGRKP